MARTHPQHPPHPHHPCPSSPPPEKGTSAEAIRTIISHAPADQHRYICTSFARSQSLLEFSLGDWRPASFGVIGYFLSCLLVAIV
ncbi:hypothetical protein GE21DRAFT_1282510 [Neurospora crassa]|nr:hypothetical protein GE21DRAFT_1282510 [Neurospora crassa]